ncbi:MAG: flagellar basal body P-ring formation chaperone FlgA [Proteobacteria bacterium]|nr:flagellar basal body P-ring formation chaperone FlgA [Pseudomonadota bacterium]MBU1388935.1 flagellar basal body P-ring formation chaperone FlgA [Pseudomonadota bacterium]MBU1543487.1 flagellar basal body P-ring formation chaperone FlgA [Pseudomonadota bacterium]MBU2431637.1 flagellar basal body P-ring formation chaperone FlgA [Pseudomonadota bacterium]MBU2482636.1 flagellar basal body P-ring formation chaperone FlgA [Pseudomonadota bacterium]
MTLLAVGFSVFLGSGFWALYAQEGPSSAAQIKITVKETSQVNQDDIYLGDIADIHASDFLKEALSKIDVDTSPKPDKIKLLDNKKILSAIHTQQYLPENIKIVIPEHVYVKRMSQEITKQDIRTFLEQHLSTAYKGREFNLASLSVRGLELYPQGDVDFVLSSNDIVSQNGRLAVFLDVNINRKKQDRVSVTGQVDVFEKVLCVNRSFPKGKQLSREDVYLKKLNIFNLSGDYIKQFDRIENKILKTGVKKDEYLRSDLIEQQPLIQKGDIVTLVSKNENLLIVTSGVSKEDGFENELIRVENLNSGRLVQGIVRGKTKVEVRF